MTTARAEAEYLKQINGTRIFLPGPPPDEIAARELLLWWENPYTVVNEDGSPVREGDVERWPALRREIVRESHEPVMQSLARYGALP